VLTRLDDMPAGVLGFEATGELAVRDYTDVLVPALHDATDGGAKARIVMVFPEGFGGVQVGAVWQDLKMGIREWSAWERIALVTDTEWMRNGLRRFGWAIPGEVRDFPLSQRAEAVAWAAGGG
jgi:hypothetical protein